MRSRTLAVFLAAASLTACFVPIAATTTDVMLPVPVVVGTIPPIEDTGFTLKYVPSAALKAAQATGGPYSPIIEFTLKSVEAVHIRWPKATVSYHEGPRPLSASQRKLVKTEIDRVNQAIGLRIYKYVGEGASADIVVTDSTSLAPSTVLGVTTANLTTRVKGEEVSIELTEDIQVRADIRSDSLFQKVILHEYGHAAGLEHDPEIDSLMHRSTGARTAFDFSATERNTLRLLYGMPDKKAVPKKAMATQALESLQLLTCRLHPPEALWHWSFEIRTPERFNGVPSAMDASACVY